MRKYQMTNGSPHYELIYKIIVNYICPSYISFVKLEINQSLSYKNYKNILCNIINVSCYSHISSKLRSLVHLFFIESTANITTTRPFPQCSVSIKEDRDMRQFWVFPRQHNCWRSILEDSEWYVMFATFLKTYLDHTIGKHGKSRQFIIYYIAKWSYKHIFDSLWTLVSKQNSGKFGKSVSARFM